MNFVGLGFFFFDTVIAILEVLKTNGQSFHEVLRDWFLIADFSAMKFFQEQQVAVGKEHLCVILCVLILK